MLHRVPDFYDKFHCIADKCTDSCCIGWEIDVDENTQRKYNQVQGPFAQCLKENIEDGHFKLREGDRCPFLNEQGLCEIYRNLGESALGDICREHPRFVEVYGDIKEQGVGLCCEEAVRLLLEGSKCSESDEVRAIAHVESAPTKNGSVIHFVEREINEPEDKISAEVREARDAIFVERENLFTILSQEEIALNKRLQMMLEYAASICGMEWPGNESKEPTQSRSREEILHLWVEILGQGESFGPAWNTIYKQIKEYSSQTQGSSKESTTNLFSERDGARIIAYLLFRYYAKSLFDGDSFGKVQFAIFFWLILKEYGSILAGENPLVDARVAAIKLLSKQVEYSEEIMDILAEKFVSNEAFSIEAFNALLQ